MTAPDPQVVLRYNRDAWNHQAALGNEWTLPVGPEEVARARQGDWSIVLTPLKPVPAEWFPPMAGLRVLALASGGGQQGPIMAAAGTRASSNSDWGRRSSASPS